MPKVKDPNAGNKSEVPDAETPSLKKKDKVKEAYAAMGDAQRKVVAATLLEVIQKQIDDLAVAKKLADRLMKKGLSSEEFGKLYGFLQEDILRNLLSTGITAGRQYSDAVVLQAAKMNKSH